LSAFKKVYYKPSEQFLQYVWNYLIENPLTSSNEEILKSPFGIEEVKRQRTLGQDPLDGRYILTTTTTTI